MTKYHEQRVTANYKADLRGLGHNQLNKQRGLKGVKLGPANDGRRLSADERAAIEKAMRDSGKL